MEQELSAVEIGVCKMCGKPVFIDGASDDNVIETVVGPINKKLVHEDCGIFDVEDMD